ncbi:hypothetical protein [Bacillus sp. 1P02SD]|uniref:hypothetical protein n=1 Tax=Bacillus sp. 1P02SD TaxID=3132264 RepID=UPI0039A15CB8
MQLTTDSILSLHELEIRKDKKHYIIEDLVTHEFYEMPVVCIDAIELINNGLSLGEIEHLLKEKYPIEEVDLLDFGNQLLDLDLVNMVDGTKVSVEKARIREDLGLTWISPKIGKIFFNRFTRFFYPLLLLVNIMLFFSHTNLFPRYQDLFVFDTMMFNILLYAGISMVLIFIHESGHVLAIRSFNLPTQLQIGNRLFFVVLETNLTKAWSLSSKDRNLLFLAGIYFDSVILFITLILKMTHPFSSGLMNGIIGLITFDVVIRIIYQCCIYMKTDLYYVFENNTGNYNLMESGIEFIKGIFAKKQIEQKNRVIISYSFFFLIGILLTFTMFGFYYIPQLVYMMSNVLPGFTEPVSTLRFWDAAVFCVQFLILFILLFYSLSKKYGNRKKYRTIYSGEENNI